MSVIEKINGYEITEAEIDAFIENLPPEQRQYATNPRFRQQIIQQFVSVLLFSEYAKEEKLEETAEFAKLLESAKRDILAQLGMNKVLENVKVEENEAKAFYEDNQDKFMSQESVSAKHILVDDEAKCNEIKAEIEAGKAFEEAAQEYSSCPSKERGGDLGEFGHGQMVPEFDEASFTAKVGEIVGPVKTDFGFHLIQVYDKKEAGVMAFDEVKDQINANLLQRKQSEVYAEKIAELHEKYADK